MTEMEAKLLASIDGVKNEINDVKAEQMKKGLTNIEQVFDIPIPIELNT